MALLTLFVVFIHYSSSFVCNVKGSISLSIVDYFGQGITRNAVPLFFFMSGILTFIKVQNVKNVFQGIKKRIFSLGIPFVLWNTIAMLFFLFIGYVSKENQDQITGRTIIEGILFNKYLGPFWYIKYLILLTLLSPIIYTLFKKKYIIIPVIGLLCVLHLLGCCSWGGLYYFLGGYFAINHKSIFQTGLKKSISIVIIVVWIIFQIYRVIIYDSSMDYVSARSTTPYLVYELFSPILMWFAFDVIDYNVLTVKKYEKHTFIVYAAHYMLIALLTADAIESCYFIPNENKLYTLFIFFFMPIIIYAILTEFSIILQNNISYFYKLLTGGR